MTYWVTAEEVIAETYKPETNHHPTVEQVTTEVWQADEGPDYKQVEAELAAIRREQAATRERDNRLLGAELFLTLLPDLIRSAQKITQETQKKVTMDNRLLGERILGLED
jgi:hypothetical protein